MKLDPNKRRLVYGFATTALVIAAAALWLPTSWQAAVNQEGQWVGAPASVTHVGFGCPPTAAANVGGRPKRVLARLFRHPSVPAVPLRDLVRCGSPRGMADLSPLATIEWCDRASLRLARRMLSGRSVSRPCRRTGDEA
jgi:hypothetical protein